MSPTFRHSLFLFVSLSLVACSAFPNIEALVPSLGDVGDVIDIRDSNSSSFSMPGTVYFGREEAFEVLLWTLEDVYVRVPPDITSIVPVRVNIDGYPSNMRNFTLVDDRDLRRIMCFGDSIFHWGVLQALQGLIHEDEHLNALGLITLDQAKTGEKIAAEETWTRWENAINYGNAELVLLLEGTNDVADSANESLEDIEQAAASLINDALVRGAGPVVCTLLPRVGPCGDVQSPTTEEFNEWLKSYAGGMDLPVVDLYEDFVSTPDWEDTYFSDDCIHPNADGRQRIAELLRDQLRTLYPAPCTDLDEDGYGDPPSPSCPHPDADCNDSDPDVHPDSAEDCTNGIDDDCDTLVDLEDPDCP